ncbi:type I-C CRISPR-associated protein Cas8c/Csd1 [Deinococcus sp.]|uniref:type I-C CRISPR-associated protein Cas8c/Csd1 n=1 Tax=Deinococcus sp. TaxID=47478 RepID=UPI003B591498
MLLEQLMYYEERMRAEGRAKAEADDSGSAAGEMPFMYANQAVRWEIRLKADGTVRDVQPHSSGKTKGKDLGAPMAAPNLSRQGQGAKARLLMDNAEYVLGLQKKEGEAGLERATRFHEDFKALVKACADNTKDLSVKVVADFLNNLNSAAFQEQYFSQFSDFAADTNITFSVDNVMPISLVSVQKFWASRFEPSESAGEDAPTLIAECLITGEVGPVMRTEPVKIKGISGGHTAGMSFISGNQDSFLSYGMKQANIAPVKFTVAEKYANGLNRLLADPATSMKMGGVTYAFWTREGGIPPISQALTQPPRFKAQKTRDTKRHSQEVRAVLWGIFTGVQTDLRADSPFYMVGLTPSISRIAVRTHLTSTVQDAVTQLSNFFASQHIVPLIEDQEDKLYGVHKLAKSMYFQKIKKGQKKLYEIDDGDDTDVTDDAKQAVDLLIQHALAGQPLPISFLALLAGRNRAEKRVTRPRAALTKMVLLSGSFKEFDVTNAQLDALDTARPEAAYHLGRLLAVLDDIQSSVMKANTTLVDRFYGSMSTTPYAVVGRLIQGTQAHLQKLRKENEGAYVMKQRALEEVMNALHDIPAKPLSTPQQALFSLGYYHQRAAIASGYRERKAARDAVKTAQTDTQNQGESE